MQFIFYTLGTAYILVQLNLLQQWWVLASIVIFLVGKYIIQAIYFIMHKQFEYQKNKVELESTIKNYSGYSNYSNLVNSNIKNKNNIITKEDEEQEAARMYKERVEKALKEREAIVNKNKTKK